MTGDDLAAAIQAALADLIEAGDLPAFDLPEVRVERPKSREHGDFATNAPLAAAKAAGRPPREIAALLAQRLSGTPGVAAAEVAGPGFVNVRLDSATQGELARTSV